MSIALANRVKELEARVQQLEKLVSLAGDGVDPCDYERLEKLIEQRITEATERLKRKPGRPPKHG